MKNMDDLYRQARVKWRSLYPIYFDSTKSLTEGRRVPKQLAIQSPTCEQISRAVGMCKIRNIIEPHKAYSRDFLERGRIKAQVFNIDDGKAMNPEITSKKRFLIAVANNLKTVRSEKDKNPKVNK